MTPNFFALPFLAVEWLSSGIAYGITEAIRSLYRLAGVEVELRAICLNSVCALMVSPLSIDSVSFQNILGLGTYILTWELIALAILVAIRILRRCRARHCSSPGDKMR